MFRIQGTTYTSQRRVISTFHMERVICLLQQLQIPREETNAVARSDCNDVSAQTHIKNDISKLKRANLVRCVQKSMPHRGKRT